MPDAAGRGGREQVLFHVHAYDWNCPQHITPRFTAEEFDVAVDPLRTELTRLRAENAALRGRLDGATTSGAPARAGTREPSDTW